MKNKKGVEQPQLIVYVLFTVILTLTGIYVAFTYLGGVKIAFEFQDYASRLNVVTAKLVNSPSCYAAETQYTTQTGTFYQVDVGKINWQRFNNSNKIPDGCVGINEKQVLVDLEFLDSRIRDKVWTCQQQRASCAAPTKEELVNGWNPTERSMLVQIKNGESLSLGRLTVRLKS